MKKIVLSIFCCLIVLLATTGCEDKYDKDDAKKDIIDYLENKYNEEFEVNITKTFSCSGGIGICEYRGEAFIKDKADSKCEVGIHYDEYYDNCESITK